MIVFTAGEAAGSELEGSKSSARSLIKLIDRTKLSFASLALLLVPRLPIFAETSTKLGTDIQQPVNKGKVDKV